MPALAQAFISPNGVTYGSQTGDTRVVLSIGRGDGVVAEVHMAISLGPQADAARYPLRQRVFKIALAVEIALDLGSTDANLEFVPLFRHGTRFEDPFNTRA